MAGQETTNPDAGSGPELTPQQEAAVDLLTVGNTVTQVAESVGVARQTVSEWLNHHHAFRAALNGRRQELWRQLTDRMRALLPKALDALDRALNEDGKDAQDAAVQVLKACGMYGLDRPMGYTTTEEFHIADQEQECARRRRLMFAAL
ncbi:MAG: hypothetical protein AB7P78_08825 [Candidatus Binatia bacterium]